MTDPAIVTAAEDVRHLSTLLCNAVRHLTNVAANAPGDLLEVDPFSLDDAGRSLRRATVVVEALAEAGFAGLGEGEPWLYGRDAQERSNTLGRLVEYAADLVDQVGL